MTGEIVRFSPTLEIDDGRAQHIRRGQSSPIRLVFWVELGLSIVGCSSVGPGLYVVLARRYPGLGRIRLRVYNKWYQRAEGRETCKISVVTFDDGGARESLQVPPLENLNSGPVIASSNGRVGSDV